MKEPAVLYISIWTAWKTFCLCRAWTQMITFLSQSCSAVGQVFKITPFLLIYGLAHHSKMHGGVHLPPTVIVLYLQSYWVSKLMARKRYLNVDYGFLRKDMVHSYRVQVEYCLFRPSIWILRQNLQTHTIQSSSCGYRLKLFLIIKKIDGVDKVESKLNMHTVWRHNINSCTDDTVHFGIRKNFVLSDRKFWFNFLKYSMY